MINMTRKIPRPYNTVRGEITRCTTLLPRKLSSALGAPVTGRDRPALFRRETPGPVQRSASAGSHQPPALFRGPCSVFFPSQSFAKIKDIVPALPGFVNPGFPGKFPSPAAKMLTKQPPALIIRKNTRRFPPLKRRRRSVICNRSSSPATDPPAACTWATMWAP